MFKILFLTFIAFNVCFSFGYNWNQKSEIEYICKLPALTGQCKADILRYVYNQLTQRCEPFTYGGCDGNENNFETLEDCQKCCPKSSDTSCPSVNITTCERPLDEDQGICSGGPFDLYRSENSTCGTACPLVCGEEDPQFCILICIYNICQCSGDTYRRLSDCQCVHNTSCNVDYQHWYQNIPNNHIEWHGLGYKKA